MATSQVDEAKARARQLAETKIKVCVFCYKPRLFFKRNRAVTASACCPYHQTPGNRGTACAVQAAW